MKKVLIITYYWIPSGGSGVQRWVKFVKYLRDFAWEPIVYAPKNPDYPLIDESFVDDIPADIEVIKHKIWEPYQLYRRFSGNKNKAIQTGFVVDNKQTSWKDKLSIWLRGNLFIPDARTFWVRPSIRKLKKYLKNNPVDAIITTGPPHSTHLIGKGLKHEFPHIPWIADFRDPWTNIFYYKELKLTKLADKIHQALEKEVIETADAVLVVSDIMKKDFEDYANRKIYVLPNGFDADDFPKTKVELEDKFVITHTGLLTDKQNPTILWKVLQDISKEDDSFKNDLRIRLVGELSKTTIDDLRTYQLSDNLILSQTVSHAQAIEYQRNSQLLLLCMFDDPSTKSVLTGKLFEYLQAKRPVIGIGFTDGDAAAVLQNTQAGYMFDFTDYRFLKEKILDYYQAYKQEGIQIHSRQEVINQYSRENLTEKLSSLLNNLIKD